ncbi:chorismate pyruvate-lyase family protein [Nonomuraea sp. NPDC049695]|uniref:chorismate pyruvate-lyase family protein n=1 Tax=Nonomuraea sp. NPDC049695 TaxID=3154734 RepID=UPI00341BD6D1
MTPTPLTFSSDPGRVADVLGSLDGSTTRFLSALLDEPLKAKVMLQARRPAAGALPTAVLSRMRPAADDIVIVRRSQLVVADTGAVISENKVVLDIGHPLMADLDLGTDIPIGYLLSEVEQRRELLQRGVRRWSWGMPDPFSTTRPSAWRSYLIVNGGRPICYIEEVFHPDIVAPASQTYGPGEHDERLPVAVAG